MPRRTCILVAVLLPAALWVGAAESLIRYDNRPLGTRSEPLILRTYLPEPGLDPAILPHHGRGFVTSEYSPERGADLPELIAPLNGLPAAIAINHGLQLSYVFDSIEGRLLYAWSGGFLDMLPYWGERGLGTRTYDYVPRLVGALFYKAQGPHPLRINGKSVADFPRPQFIGYDLEDGVPTFLVRHGAYVVSTTVLPDEAPHTLRVTFSVSPEAELSFRTEEPNSGITREVKPTGELAVTIAGDVVETFAGYTREVTLKASVEEGEKLYRNYACSVCHSTDGSAGHGPTFANLFGRERRLADGTVVVADEAYLLESIAAPNAKIAQGFAPGFMPAFDQFRDVEYQSLVQYIKSLAAPQPE